MKTIYLIRHGQKVNQPGDPPLTDLGKKQAILTANHIKSLSFDLIVSSPSLRARQTAQIIADTTGMSLKIEPSITERMNWGDIKGQTFDDFWQEWIRSSSEPDYQPTPGISSKMNGQRFLLFLADLLKKAKTNTVLIVSHGGTIGDGLRTILGDDQLPLIHEPDGNTYLDIKECSITTIIYDGQKFQLTAINQIGHLKP
jgi:broad specificity phosphatase PhoE